MFGNIEFYYSFHKNSTKHSKILLCHLNRRCLVRLIAVGNFDCNSLNIQNLLVLF